MEKNNKGLMVLVFLLTAVVFTMAVGFAVNAYDQSLQINGSATFKAGKWSVHFNKSSYLEITNSTVSTDSSFDVNGTVLTLSNVVLSEPGDIYEFTIDVVNDGTFDAYLNDLFIKAIPTELQDVVSLTVTTNSGIYTNTSIVENANITTLVANTGVEKIKVTLKYNETSPSLDEDVTMDLVMSFNYKQVI